MKRALCLLLLVFSAYGYGQDFAARFMEQCEDRDELRCQTIGPRMMERLIDVPAATAENKGEADTGYLLSRLKSARIVTTERHGEKYFDQARQLIEKNRNRFAPLSENTTAGNNQIFVRRHDGRILELVMLNFNPEEEVLTIVDFTGEMDDGFIRRLKGRKRDD